MTPSLGSEHERSANALDPAGMVIAGVLLLLAVVIFWDTSALQITPTYGVGPKAMPYRHRDRPGRCSRIGNFCAGAGAAISPSAKASIRRRSCSSSAASPR